MQQLLDLANMAKENGLAFLLIGGHAVWALGYQRNTFDLDLLVRAEQVNKWLHVLAKAGYGTFAQTDSFLQLVPPAGASPLDLLLVDDNTWNKLHAERVQHPNLGPEIATPAPIHLIALKLHALRQQPLRSAKDWLDIDELIRVHKIDVRTPEFKAMVVRYAGRPAYDRISQNHGIA